MQTKVMAKLFTQGIIQGSWSMFSAGNGGFHLFRPTIFYVSTVREAWIGPDWNP